MNKIRTKIKFLNKLNSKSHNKVRYVGKKFFLINSDTYYTNLIKNFFKNKKKNNIFFFKKFKKKNILKDLSFNSFINSNHLIFRTYRTPCLIATEFGKCTDYHLETIRRIIKKNFSKRTLIFKRINPYKKLLKRTNEVRMGGGKGAKYDKIIYPIYPGCILFEVRGSTNKLARSILNYAATKLPFKTKSIILDFV